MSEIVVIQAIASAGAVGSAIIALYTTRAARESTAKLQRATEEWSETLVRPRLIVRGSTKEQRQKYPIGENGLTRTQVDFPGILVENIGIGPAIKGLIEVINDDGSRTEIKEPDEPYSFVRIPAGQPPYHYPSYDSPSLENIIQGRNRIKLEITYYDIRNKPYRLSEVPEEQEIQLYA